MVATGHRTGFRRTILFATAATILTVVGVGAIGGGAVDSSAVSEQVILSRLSAYVGPGDPSAVGSFGRAIGRKVAFASDYLDDRSWGGIDNDTWLVNRWQGSGFRMILAVPMLPIGVGATLGDGATGLYDGHFLALAHQLVNHHMQNAILRVGWEFNVPTYPWYAAGQPTAFVKYWRHIVNTMRSVKGEQFQFEWDPDRGDGGLDDTQMGDYDSYYPGNSYVNIIAMDVYDEQWQYFPGEPVEINTIEDQEWGLNWLAAFAKEHRKRTAIAEFGLGQGPYSPNSGPAYGSGNVGGGSDDTFIEGIIQWAIVNDVVNLVYWDVGSSALSQNPSVATDLRVFVDTGQLDR